MVFKHTFTADGYSNSFRISGGPCEFRVTYTAGTGTVSLRRANKDAAKTSAAAFQEFHADTTVTEDTAIGFQASEALYCFQLSSGATPNIEVEVASGDSGHIDIVDTQKQVA